MRLQRPFTSSERSQRKPEFDEGMKSATVLGHSSQPAATIGFDSRKINLEPKNKGTILRAHGEKPFWGKIVGGKHTIDRSSMDKDNLRAPASRSEIRIRADTMLFKAEKQITNNPLLQGACLAENQSTALSASKTRQAKSKPIIVRDISSISLPELCVLHNAFLNADEDKNGTLDPNEFITAFIPFFSNPGDVNRLFMRIDADCDGIVSWEEILSFVLSQDDAKMSINAEYMKREFLYPVSTENSQSGGHRENAAGLIFLSDADRYISYEPKGEILIWKIDEAEEVSKFHRPKNIRTDLAHISGIVHIQHFYNSERLALFSTEKQLTFMDLMREGCKQSGIVKLDFSPYCFNAVNLLSDAGEIIEQALAFGDDRGTIHLFRANELHRCAEFNMRVTNRDERSAGESHLRSWSAHERSAFVYKVEYCADIKLLISCSSDGQVVFSDVEGGCVKGDGFKHRSDVHDFVWLRKFQQLVSCGIERHIKVWQLGLKSPVEKLQGHQTSVQRLLWEGGQLISLDASKVIIIWDVSAMLSIQRLDCIKAHPDHPISGITYDARRNTIATLGRSICLWQAADRKAPNGHIHPITCALFNPLFEMAITADDSAEIRVWDLNTGAVIFCFSRAHVNAKGENVKVSAMTFDITLRRLVTGAHDGSAKIWNFSTGQCLGVLEGFGKGEISAMTSMTIKPYNYIVACGWNKKVTFWLDAHSHQGRKGFGPDTEGTYPTYFPSSSFSGHRDDILSMACHLDTSLLVTGSYDGDIIIWKVESGTVRTRLILPGILSMQGDQKPIEQITTIDCGVLSGATDAGSDATSLVLIATIGGDEFIRIWSSDSSAELLLEVKRVIDSDDRFTDTADLGLVGLCVCSRNKVMVVADTEHFVVVYDISKMIESSHACVESRTQDLEPPYKTCKFHSQSGPIVSLTYINTRRLVLVCSQDCSISLWTLFGEKMGNFGEISDWKFSRDMHHYEQQMDDPALEGFSGRHGSAEAGAAGSAKSIIRGQQRRGESLPKKSTTQFMSMQRRQSLKNKIDLMRGSDFSGAKKSKDAVDDINSFFLTGTTDFYENSIVQPETDVEGTMESIEDDIEDVLKESAVSEPELWTDSEVSESGAPEEDEINYQLKENIDNILSRASSMKERGERFFEPGQPVVPAYQKIRVSDISDVEIPDNIAKRITFHKGQGKRFTGAAAKRRPEV